MLVQTSVVTRWAPSHAAAGLLKVFTQAAPFIDADAIVLVKGRLDHRGREPQIRALEILEPSFAAGVASAPSGTLVIELRPEQCTPAVLGAAPAEVRGRRVLVVDETCDSGETMRLAVAAVVNAGAGDVRTAVSFRTGDYEPNYAALETDAVIVLPWDREILVDGALVPNPKYDATG